MVFWRRWTLSGSRPRASTQGTKSLAQQPEPAAAGPVQLQWWSPCGGTSKTLSPSAADSSILKKSPERYAYKGKGFVSSCRVSREGI